MPVEALPVSGGGGGGPPLSDAAPQNVGVTAPGVSPDASRSDHVHAHGNQAGGGLHAVAVANGANGFLSGADKAKLDALTPGGGTGGLGTFVTPPSAGWAWTNQGTASVVASADGTAFTLIKPPGGTDNYALYTRPIPASKRVSIAMRVLVAGGMASGQFPSGGICLLESGTGKFVAASIVGDGTGTTGPYLRVQKFTNVNTFASDYTQQLYHFQDLTRLKLFQGSAGAERRTVEWGLDGEIWLPQKLVDVLYSDFCVPDRIGFCANGYGAAANSTYGVLVKALSWDES